MWSYCALYVLTHRAHTCCMSACSVHTHRRLSGSLSTASRRPMVTVPICWRGRRRQVSLRLFIQPPACSKIDWIVILFNSLKRLSFSLSYLLVASNGSILLLSPCHIFVVQSLAFSICLSKIRSLMWWLLSTVLIQFENPMFRILNSLSSCCVWMILQGNSVMQHYVLLCPSNIWQRLSVCVVVMPSLEYGWMSSMLGLTSFLQHFLSLVQLSLSFRRSMFGTGSVIIVVVLVELLSSLRRFSTSSASAINNADLQYKLQSGHCFLEGVSQSSKISVLFMSATCDFLLNLLIFSICLKSCRDDSLFGWVSNFSINFLALSLRFVSCCSTVERGIPSIRWVGHKMFLRLVLVDLLTAVRIRFEYNPWKSRGKANLVE